MLKAIIKFFLHTKVGRMILNEYFDLFLAWILKWFAERHNHERELPIVSKIEAGLQELNIEDFIREKDDAEFRFLASRVIKAKHDHVLAVGARNGKIVI